MRETITPIHDQSPLPAGEHDPREPNYTIAALEAVREKDPDLVCTIEELLEVAKDPQSPYMHFPAGYAGREGESVVLTERGPESEEDRSTVLIVQHNLDSSRPLGKQLKHAKVILKVSQQGQGTQEDGTDSSVAARTVLSHEESDQDIHDVANRGGHKIDGDLIETQSSNREHAEDIVHRLVDGLAEHYSRIDYSLGKLDQVDSQLANAIRAARHVGWTTSGLWGEAISTTGAGYLKERGSSLDLEYLRTADHRRQAKYGGPALLGISVIDWVNKLGKDPTVVKAKLRLTEDGQLLAGETHFEYGQQKEDGGRGDPNKVRGFVLDVAHEIIEQNQASDS